MTGRDDESEVDSVVVALDGDDVVGSMDEWLASLDRSERVELGVSAADLVAEVRSKYQ